MKFKNEKGSSINLLAGLSTINRLLIVVLVLVITMITIGFRLTLPQIRGILRINRQNSELKQKLATLEKKINDLGSYNRPEIDGLYRKVLEAIPSENHYLKLLTQIKYLANQNNIGIVNIQVKPGVIDVNNDDKKPSGGDSRMNNLIFDAKVQGDLSSLSRWVRSLETSLPLSDVSRIDFEIVNRSASASASRILEADIQITSYWSKLPDYLGKVGSAVTKLDKSDYDTISLFDKYTTVPVSILPGVDNSEYRGAVGKDNPFP